MRLYQFVFFVCVVLLIARTAVVETIAFGQSATENTERSTAGPASIGDPLLRLLVSKGLLKQRKLK